MSKVVATYWDNSSAVVMRKKKRTKRATTPTNAKPQWFAFAAIVLLTFLICIAINIRAFSEMYAEMSQHSTLNSEIEKLEAENKELQKEVESLKTDEKTIEREARKIGLSRPE